MSRIQAKSRKAAGCSKCSRMVSRARRRFTRTPASRQPDGTCEPFRGPSARPSRATPRYLSRGLGIRTAEAGDKSRRIGATDASASGASVVAECGDSTFGKYSAGRRNKTGAGPFTESLPNPFADTVPRTVETPCPRDAVSRSRVVELEHRRPGLRVCRRARMAGDDPAGHRAA